MNCPICASTKITTAYSGKIRNGVPGQLTDSKVDVYRCGGCHCFWHQGAAESSSHYESDSYRNSMGEAVSLQEFYGRHDAEILDKLRYTGTAIYRGKLFMDIGCGGGGFADFVRGAARSMTLVEPNMSFAALLREKGYEVFAYLGDALKKHQNSVELITSFDVIEHVDDPQGFLSSVYSLMAPGGKAYIGTPTEHPVLRGLLGEEFDSFVFSVQHPWVLSRQSLGLMAERCGFSAFEVKFYQRFGLGNLVAWLQSRKPMGEASFDFITPALNAHYKSEMANEATADYLVLEIMK